MKFVIRDGKRSKVFDDLVDKYLVPNITGVNAMKLKAIESDVMCWCDVQKGTPIKLLECVPYTLPRGTIGYRVFIKGQYYFSVLANAELDTHLIKDVNPRVELVKFPITLENE